MNAYAPRQGRAGRIRISGASPGLRNRGGDENPMTAVSGCVSSSARVLSVREGTMSIKRLANSRRIQLLRVARKKIAALTKSRFQKRLPADLKRMDGEAARVRRRVAAGKITKREAKRSLGQLAKLRREGARLMVSTRTLTRRTLAEIDRELARLQGAR